MRIEKVTESERWVEVSRKIGNLVSVVRRNKEADDAGFYRVLLGL